jgi:hypothetical protein
MFLLSKLPCRHETTRYQTAMNTELEARIRQRANELWESAGRPDGLADQHWLAAEQAVREEDGNGTVPTETESDVEAGNEAAGATETAPASDRTAGDVELAAGAG